ncbi:hypothetical protein F5876DRAFT_43739 [Lentinula aff. lateritia]|uniref:Uncharacterized protein n=1 Tax=Lentinula aff. lateritia TaxID=2804960 RepID=A0ACC1TXL3_9AGAR|nr:hypothetical protein F5876DRAFT_43739 [Lentinula aff. lateritia]
MSVLDDVRKIHPVVDVVVLAFKAVVTLELKRRDNDQKVLVLQVKMQDMMEIFVQLRVIAPNQKESGRGFTVEESLKKICSRIAEDIWSCANLCDSYSKKRLLVKLLKSPIYEGRLAGYIQTFVERRTELHTVLGMFTAHKIHSTFSLLENNQEVLKSINNSIQVIFERLRTQTPIEKQIWKLIESKGGLEKCTEDESVLTELVKFDLYGCVGDRSWFTTSDPPGPPAHEVNQLKQELQLDVDDDLKKNMAVFKRKLDEQQRQLQQIENTVITQGDRVISVVREGPHDRIYDPELRAIWKEMARTRGHSSFYGWKLGVPVQEFVHTLHDYYIAQNNDSAVLDNYFTVPASPGSTADDQTLALRAAFSAAKQRAAEKWALKHINIKNIIPLLEVFDGDASGFVSVWEANQVASLRPKDWSFLQWLAYWAAGRHFTIWQYRQKIGTIILQMFKSVEDLIPTNRDTVNHYLLGLWAVDQILCQIVPCTEPPDGILAEKIASYTHTEEDIMEQKLRALNYEIDGPDTLGLIIGDSQIERNLLPLIYLLLKFHLMIIRAGSRTVYDCEELSTAEETLSQIFDAIFARVDTLYCQSS